MAYVHYDRISETTTTSGTADLVVSGALPGARPFSTLTDGDQFVYCLEEGTSYEIADGTWNSATSKITRGTLHSGTTGAKLNLSGSGATVMLIVSSKWIQELEATIAANQLNLIEEAGSVVRPVSDQGASLGSASYQFADGHFADIHIAGMAWPTTPGSNGQALIRSSSGQLGWGSFLKLTDFITLSDRIGATESDIDDLQAIHAAAIADGTYTTAGGDEITVADGVVTAFAKGTGSHGFKISNNTTDADHDLDIAAGACLSWDRTTWIAGAAMTKRFDASWTAGNGNGGMDTGSIPTSSGLYLYAIYHPSNGVDYIGSISPPTTGPSLPSGYTKHAYIGWRPTNGTADFYRITQLGIDHHIEVYLQLFDTQNPGTGNIDVTLPVPANSIARLMWLPFNGTGSTTVSFYSGSTSGTPSKLALQINPSLEDERETVRDEVPVDASRQFRYRLSYSNSSVYARAFVDGWRDHALQGLGN
ncbi:hypothetical protein AB1K70_26680 [Bremerella sp. JC770]|uniref:hypothetical protein n=1 Tax=Bremerella sp. JC770 TaxID=3232137 RepID=UPI0034574679